MAWDKKGNQKIYRRMAAGLKEMLSYEIIEIT